jgi:uncharacterized protein with HEPN domain
VEFTSNHSRQEFESDIKNWSATCYQLQIIGEAASKVSSDCKAVHTEIPWRKIVGLRHHLVHNYGGLIADELWSTIQQDVPALIILLEPLVPTDEPPPARSAAETPS